MIFHRLSGLFQFSYRVCALPPRSLSPAKKHFSRIFVRTYPAQCDKNYQKMSSRVLEKGQMMVQKRAGWVPSTKWETLNDFDNKFLKNGEMMMMMMSRSLPFCRVSFHHCQVQAHLSLAQLYTSFPKILNSQSRMRMPKPQLNASWPKSSPFYLPVNLDLNFLENPQNEASGISPSGPQLLW